MSRLTGLPEVDLLIINNVNSHVWLFINKYLNKLYTKTATPVKSHQDAYSACKRGDYITIYLMDISLITSHCVVIAIKKNYEVIVKMILTRCDQFLTTSSCPIVVNRIKNIYRKLNSYYINLTLTSPMASKLVKYIVPCYYMFEINCKLESTRNILTQIYGETAEIVCMSGDVEKLRRMALGSYNPDDLIYCAYISQNDEMIYFVENLGVTSWTFALAAACYMEDVDRINELLTSKNDDVIDISYPLLVVCSIGKLDILKLLMSYNYNIDQSILNNMINSAAIYNYKDIVFYLLNELTAQSAMEGAIIGYNLKLFRMIQNKYNIDIGYLKCDPYVYASII